MNGKKMRLMKKYKSSQKTIYINGKWASQSLTGTQRFAHEIVRRLESDGDLRFVVCLPSNAIDAYDFGPSIETRRFRSRGHFFEQVALPLATWGKILVNLGGAAPVLKRRQIVTLHDVTPFRHGETYRRSFTLWYRLMYRYLSQTAQKILTVSEFSKSEIEFILPRSQGKICVVSNASDHVMESVPVRPANLGDDLGNFVVCLGTNAVHKNIAPVLAELNEYGIVTVVVGDFDQSKVFSASEISSGTNIIRLGRLD
ncbi:hypothetical protein [Arthrobacter psychrolactophilus]